MTYIPNNSIVHTSGIEVYSGSGTSVGSEDVVLTTIPIDKRIKAIRFAGISSGARTTAYNGILRSSSAMLICNTWGHLEYHYIYSNGPYNFSNKNYANFWVVNAAKRTLGQRVNNSSSQFMPITNSTSSGPVIAILDYHPSNTVTRICSVIGRTDSYQRCNHSVIAIVYTESI